MILLWYQKVIWSEASDQALAAVEAAGVEIIRPDKNPFEEAVTGLIEEYRGQPEIWKWIELIRAVEATASEEGP